MNTDKQRIINFLIEHPDWVDAYRLVMPGMWIRLDWGKGSQQPILYTFHNDGATRYPDNPDYLVLPPWGEWRPLPEPQTFESRMVKSAHVGASCSDDSWATPLVRVDERFAGHTVRVTVEAIS